MKDPEHILDCEKRIKGPIFNYFLDEQVMSKSSRELTKSDYILRKSRSHTGYI